MSCTLFQAIGMDGIIVILPVDLFFAVVVGSEPRMGLVNVQFQKVDSRLKVFNMISGCDTSRPT
jgi:hypothetical protein